MKFEVHLTRAAEKDLDRLGSDAERSQVIAALRNLELNPYAGQALAGDLAGFYSLHLTLPSGQARVIYTIYPERLVILVIALGMRESIYHKAVQRAGIKRK
ncbi:MAG: type II toxin-antitoxin system RelE/ParE family toxin [Firmicutes bacterium]|nr:type II toxin-antitoxin system RelE/ParE family toxin [Bacillota bacterium]